MLGAGGILLWALVLPGTLAQAQDTGQIVRQAVQTELAADRDDHSRWIYLETDKKPAQSVKQWVAETGDGSLQRVIEMDGQPIPQAEQRRKLDGFLQDSSARSRQRRSEQHDDQQAAELLNLLPQAFIWTYVGTRGTDTVLHFRPNPQFRPPDFEARVFAAMEGDMRVDTAQHRIASLKGRLIHDVKILGGFLASLYAGGTFDVERRETGPNIWQITETHVHIQGHALLFKTISDQEDDVKTNFGPLPGNINLQQAETKLFAEGKNS